MYLGGDAERNGNEIPLSEINGNEFSEINANEIRNSMPTDFRNTLNASRNTLNTDAFGEMTNNIRLVIFQFPIQM